MLLITKSYWRHAVLLAAFLLFAISFVNFDHTIAQSTNPILISHPDSTRAIAFDSVTRRREPFNTTAEVKFGSDSATRIMLFAMNLQPQPGETITADAEAADHTLYSLTVEYIGPVPDNPWVSSVVIRVPENLPATGDVLVQIKYRDLASNRVRVGIGIVGGGPADDPNAIPTPGLESPFTPPPGALLATNLSTTDIQTILQQAASTATSLGKPVTIVITDREGNV